MLPSTQKNRHLSSHPSCTFLVLLQHPLQAGPATDVCPPCPTTHSGIHPIQDLHMSPVAAEHVMMGILVYSLARVEEQALLVSQHLIWFLVMRCVAMSTHHSALVCSIRWCEGEVQCLSCHHLL